MRFPSGVRSRPTGRDSKLLNSLRTLEKYFPKCYTRFLGTGSLLSCDGGISSQRCFELVPFVGAELHLSASHQVCWTLSSGLLGPMLQSHPPREKEGDLRGLVPVARNTLLIDHIRSGIRLDEGEIAWQFDLTASRQSSG